MVIKIACSDSRKPIQDENIVLNTNSYPSLLVYHLLKKHFPVVLSQTPDFAIIDWHAYHYGNLHKHYKCTRILTSGEPFSLLLGERSIFDHVFGYVKNSSRNYYLPLYRIMYQDYPRLFDIRDVKKFLEQKKYFCNFIYRNNNPRHEGVVKRNELFIRLSKVKHVDSLGKVFSNKVIEENYPAEIKNMNPHLQKVKYILPQYKFSITFENHSKPGYTTEKIMHAFITGSIPIYWGDPEISKLFNPKAFINVSDYSSMDELIDYILKVDNDKDLYISYLEQPPFVNNQEPAILNQQPLLDRFDNIFTSRRRPYAKTWYRKTFANLTEKLVPRKIIKINRKTII